MAGRTPQEVFQHHAEVLIGGDLEGIVSDYSDDAVFITPAGVTLRIRWLAASAISRLSLLSKAMAAGFMGSVSDWAMIRVCPDASIV